jgi:hypothetical protein
MEPAKISKDSNILGKRSALLHRCACGALLHKFTMVESVVCEGCGTTWGPVLIPQEL